MMKVFLVDDEIAIRENLRNSFPWEQNGFQLVGEAPDGEMALPMIRDLNPDILLTDIRMPFMDGMALCAEVKRVLPWIGVVILSGYDDFSYARQAISLGVKEYLLKPITADELGEALRRVAGQIAEERRAQSLRREAASGNPFLREKLLASLFTEEGDRFEDEQLMRQMRAMGVNLAAGCYAVIDIAFPLKDEARPGPGRPFPPWRRPAAAACSPAACPTGPGRWCWATTSGTPRSGPIPSRPRRPTCPSWRAARTCCCPSGRR